MAVIDPETAALIEHAKDNLRLARQQGRPDLAEQCQAVIDDLTAVDEVARGASLRRERAEDDLAEAQEKYRRETGAQWVEDGPSR